jgi:hypothetical protein
MASRDTLKSWWQTMLAIGLVGLILSLVVGEWVLAGLCGLLALYSALIMRIKARKAQGRPWS